MSPVGGGARPVPLVAWDWWLDSLTRAGWSPRSGSGGSGDSNASHGRNSERVAAGEALGRVTAVPVVARWPSPRADCAAMDGIAARAADLAAAPGALAAEAVAGHDGTNDGTVRLPAGLFEWIDTGDPMPPGADTVVVRERLLPQADGSVVIAPAASEGAGSGRRPGTEHAGGTCGRRARTSRPGRSWCPRDGGSAPVTWPPRRPAGT